MSAALLVHCHPTPGSFTSAVRDRVLAGLSAAGHDVRQIDITDQPCAEAPNGERSIVLVYPTWWSGQPAVLQHWLATHHDRFGAVDRLIAVTTHGSPYRTNLFEGQAGRRILRREVLPRCAPGARFQWLACYRIDDCPNDDRLAFLDRVERHFTRLR